LLFVYSVYGVALARTARDQSYQGVNVSRYSLRLGDLVFFFVPGRFRTNTTVGHVGIYIGNNKMIDADSLPKNGVQITDLNRPYWKRTFLRARRVAY
jgi:cell wall-associated NlpC family hydrolase